MFPPYLNNCPKCESKNIGQYNEPFVVDGTRSMYIQCFCNEDECEHEWDEMWVFIKNLPPNHDLQ